MASDKKAANDPTESITRFCQNFPGAEEGTSCNKISFKAGKKAFVYLQIEDESWNVFLKLGDSLPEAEKLAEKDPDHFSAGSNG